MAKKLKIWNGGGLCCRKPGDPRWDNLPFNVDTQAYVAAYSRADARRVIAEYCGREPADGELRDYWHEGHWGRNMDGITPERGLWLKFPAGEAPVRVI